MEEKLMKDLEAIKHKIPWQTYKTIIGQMRAGDVKGAAIGIDRLKMRIAREEGRHAYCNR